MTAAVLVRARAELAGAGHTVVLQGTSRTAALSMTDPLPQPVVNPMLGPSQSALINFGARFPPCMKAIPTTLIPANAEFGCLNNTANPPTQLCSVEDLCGFGGFHGQPPDQWWRYAPSSTG